MSIKLDILNWKRIRIKGGILNSYEYINGYFDNNIYLEIQYKHDNKVETGQHQLATLASFINIISGNSITNITLKRMIPGEISFINNKLVSSYTLEYKESHWGPDAYRARIVLEDGNLFDRTVVDGYLY